MFSGVVQFAKLQINLKIERHGHGSNSMPWFWSLSPKPKIPRPLLFPVSLPSPFSTFFSSAAKLIFADANVARNITGQTRAKKPVEEWMENRQMPTVLKRFATGSCLRFAPRMVLFPTGSVRFVNMKGSGSVPIVSASFRGSRFGSRTTLWLSFYSICPFLFSFFFLPSFPLSDFPFSSTFFFLFLPLIVQHSKSI